ncbi:hypothetical protein BV25DRAFT_1829752, partial [Artomyces pyxidatus]
MCTKTVLDHPKCRNSDDTSVLVLTQLQIYVLVVVRSIVWLWVTSNMGRSPSATKTEKMCRMAN